MTSDICTHTSFSQFSFWRFWDLSLKTWLGKHHWRLLLCSPAHHTDVCLSALPRWGGLIFYLHLHNSMILEVKRPQKWRLADSKRLNLVSLSCHCLPCTRCLSHCEKRMKVQSERWNRVTVIRNKAMLKRQMPAWMKSNPALIFKNKYLQTSDCP